MTRTRNPWAEARSLADLGELTAMWLEGDLPEHPQCFGGPNDETTPLIPTLAAANRSAFVTITSQPGDAPSPGYDGAIWAQMPGVMGLADPGTLDRLTAGVKATPGLVLFDAPVFATRRLVSDAYVSVTVRDGQPYTRFSLLPWRILYQVLGATRNLPAAVRGAQQVLLVDQTWDDRPVLWDLLTEVSHRG